MKTFNTTGICTLEKHYMVNIERRLDEIGRMVDVGEYFCINRALQYGKTTTLSMLRKSLNKQYEVISLDFQDVSAANFRTAGMFVQSFCQMIKNKKRTGLSIPKPIEERLDDYISVCSRTLKYSSNPCNY